MKTSANVFTFAFLAALATGAGCTAILGINKDYEDVSGGSGGAASSSASHTSSSTGNEGGMNQGGGGSSQGGGGAGGGPGCSMPSDCPDPPPKDICNRASCTMGKCGFEPIPKGTATMMQTPKDCKQQQCDGLGAAINVPDDTDAPDDMNDCTIDVCSMGNPQFNPEKMGKACATMGGKVCDGNGTCVECVDDTTCLGTDICQAHVCVAATCNDMIQDGAETGVDCGGGCKGCLTGQACNGPMDCQDKVCDGTGHCAAPLCTDNVMNGTETDKDCGGNCPKCKPHQGCMIDNDCLGNLCNGNTCAETCTDTLLDNQESDVDCGGPNCFKCGFMQGCFSNGDCTTNFCLNGKCNCPQNMTFVQGQCICTNGFIDCNGTLQDGCETPVVVGAETSLTKNIPNLGHASAPGLAWSANAGLFGISWTEGSGAVQNQWFAEATAAGATFLAPLAITATSDVRAGAITLASPNFEIAYYRTAGPGLFYEVVNTGGGIIMGGEHMIAMGGSFIQPAIGVNAGNTYFVAANTTASTVTDYYPPSLNSINTFQASSAPSIAFDGVNFALVFADLATNLSINILKGGSGVIAGGIGFGQASITPQVAWDGIYYGVAFVNPSAGNTISYLAVDSAANSKTAVVQISAGAGASPTITSGDGGFRIVWSDPISGQLFYARVRRDGTKTGPDYQMTNVAAGVRRSPSIAWNGGEYAVLYDDTRNNLNDLYIQRIPACAP